jgi:hypothetical protein
MLSSFINLVSNEYLDDFLAGKDCRVAGVLSDKPVYTSICNHVGGVTAFLDRRVAWTPRIGT